MYSICVFAIFPISSFYILWLKPMKRLRENKKKIKTAVLGGSVDAAMVGGVNVAVQEAYKPDYYDMDFDIFENFTATASSLTMDSDTLVKDDPSGDATGIILI